MAEQHEQEQSGESTIDYEGMLTEARGSGPDGSVRPIPEGAEWSAEQQRGGDVIGTPGATDFVRAGMDPSDPNNYGPEGSLRYSEDKAQYVVQEEVDGQPTIKETEEAFGRGEVSEFDRDTAVGRAGIRYEKSKPDEREIIHEAYDAKRQLEHEQQEQRQQLAEQAVEELRQQGII